jgi:hypothetical protein
MAERTAKRVVSNPVFAEPVFGEPNQIPDPTGFSTPHASDKQTYEEIQKLLTKDVVKIPASRAKPADVYTLEQALGARGPATVQAIRKGGRIVFHGAGDSGADQAGLYKDEIVVTDQMTEDAFAVEESNRPAFLMHLGDIVYSFGESQYYFDQFYDAFRNYPAPIFAIPGNHDSFVVPGTARGETPLDIFQRNFCATAPVITPEARSLHRTAMTQPGVYFALEAPFVRILALFSNALEGPGVISGEDGRWPGVSDVQLKFLEAQLQKAKDESYPGALLLAVHHPPFSYSPPPKAHGRNAGGGHGSSLAMLREIDQVAARVGVYPHAFLSGHAHNYQRYTRTVNGFGRDGCDVPFVICGNSGHHVNKLVQPRRNQPSEEPQYSSDVSYMDREPAVETAGLVLEKYDDRDYGYLRISVDKDHLRIAYHQATTDGLLQSRFDLVTVELNTHSMVAN